MMLHNWKIKQVSEEEYRKYFPKPDFGDYCTNLNDLKKEKNKKMNNNNDKEHYLNIIEEVLESEISCKLTVIEAIILTWRSKEIENE